jgi:hypothetical protein
MVSSALSKSPMDVGNKTCLNLPYVFACFENKIKKLRNAFPTYIMHITLFTSYFSDLIIKILNDKLSIACVTKKMLQVRM